MANVSVTTDASDLERGIAFFLTSVHEKVKKGVGDVANEVLRLSQFEVPHDTGNLQNSGHVEDGESDAEKIVGYNTVYAAFQHEGMRADGTHVVTNWQDGRKKKYLEDPIRNNLDTFQEFLNGIFDR